MGYCVSQTDSSFLLKKENQSLAFQAAKNMPDIDYYWVKKGWCKSLTNIQDVFYEWGYDSFQDPMTGDINIISFNSEKLGVELELFKAIAPFVESGSFIEMHGEDCCIWRWVFDGKTCKEVYPAISW